MGGKATQYTVAAKEGRSVRGSRVVMMKGSREGSV